jgi:uncharacterized protein (DUF2147 family)
MNLILKRNRVFMSITLMALGGLFFSFGSRASLDEKTIYGLWETERIPEEDEQDVAHIRVEPCKSNPKKVCGHIVWTEIQIDPETGRPPQDKFNPDKSLRKRPMLCIQTLMDFEPSGEMNTFANGRLYSPRSGRSFKGIAVLNGPDHLQLKGSVFFGLISRATTWKRVQESAKDAKCGK